MLRLLPALLVAIGMVLACGGPVRTPEQVLEEQLQAFHGHLRWGRVSEASSFVDDAHRNVFLGMYEEYGDEYEVTEFELESVQYERGSDEAEVIVWMQWFRLPSTRVNEETYRETWEYDPIRRVWLMTDREMID